MSSSLAWASVASECTDSACATAYLLDSHRELGVSGVLKASLGTNLLRSPPVTAGPRLSLSGPRKTVPVNRIIVGRTVRHQLNAVSRRVSRPVSFGTMQITHHGCAAGGGRGPWDCRLVARGIVLSWKHCGGPFQLFLWDNGLQRAFVADRHDGKNCVPATSPRLRVQILNVAAFLRTRNSKRETSTSGGPFDGSRDQRVRQQERFFIAGGVRLRHRRRRQRGLR